MNRGSLLRGRGISMHEGGYYHEPVTTADLTTLLNFKQLRCKVIQINVLKHCYAFLIHLLANIFILRM